MSFKNIYNALFDQISSDSTLTGYVNDSQFLKGFRQNIPNQEYTIIFEPGNEEDVEGTMTYDKVEGITYYIDIYARIILKGADGIRGSIVGYGDKKGLLDFVDDIKSSIRSNLDLGYKRKGSSTSSENIGTSFELLSNKKYITISINNRTPVGYDSILCGSSTLTGTQVATNIQAALRALGNHDDDGYNDAICTFDNDTKKFTITSNSYNAASSVVVTAGASNDCSELLGFDNPVEVSGRNIIKIIFETVTTDNRAFPVRYRVISLRIIEEVQT